MPGWRSGFCRQSTPSDTSPWRRRLDSSQACGGRRAGTAMAVVALAAPFVPVSPASAAPSNGAATPAVSAERSAVAAAQASGHPVEVLDRTTETSRLLANPSGTFTLEQSAVPVRVRRVSGWVNLDTTLERQPDGTIAPRATVTELAFSPGGSSTPLARVATSGREFALTWPKALPAPALSGDTATYPEVLPGVDLQLRALADGFSELLVVKTRQAATQASLRTLRFLTRTAAASLRATAGGGLSVVDSSGYTWFSSPQPLMWDSSARAEGTDGDPAHGPADGSRVGRMQASVGSGAIDLVPDAAFLSAAATQFPVYLDPTMSASRTAWAMINRSYPTVPYYKWTTADEGLGYNDQAGVNVKRLFWLFNTTPVNGRHIISATFSAYDTFSVYSSCPASVAELWLTGAFTSATTWNTSPTWMSRVSSVNAVAGRTNCYPNGLRLEWDALSVVARAAQNNWPGTTLGLKAADETSNTGWKRFRSDAVLSIEYNTVPATPTGLHTESPSTACVMETETNGLKRPQIPNDPPVLVARLNDADGTAGGNIRAEFELWHTNGGRIQPQQTGLGPPGTDFKWFMPSQLVSAAGSYSWRVRAYDGIDYSAFSIWCEFTVDPYAPAIPTVAATPDNQTFTVGSSGSFTAGNGGSTDVTNYCWSLNNDATPSLPPAAPSQPLPPQCLAVDSPAFSVPFTSFGPNTVRVWSYDAARNVSPTPAALGVTVSGGGATGHWLLNDDSGTTAQDDQAGHPMTLSGAFSWTAGDQYNIDDTDRAVDFDGVSAAAATAMTNIVRTDQNFSVSAWVRPSTASTRQVFVSEDSGTGSGFTLGLLPASADGSLPAAYAFTVANSGGTTEVVDRASPGSVALNEWTHLVGVYEAGSRLLTLYVNNASVGTVAVPKTFSGSAANGPLRLGRGQSGGAGTWFGGGDVDDVWVFNGVISDSRRNSLWQHPSPS